MPDSNSAVPFSGLDPNMQVEQERDKGLKWLSVREKPFHVAGFPWLSQDGVYRRLPVTPSSAIPSAVDQLAGCTAGGQIRFRSDSRELSVRVRLQGPGNMYHMPATGQCGFDCYLGSEEGKWRYHSTTMWNHTQTSYTYSFYEMPERAERNIRLYFPLYQGVEEVLVGIEPDASVSTAPPYALGGRAIFYGTSITQGGCASRPGMAYTNILSRRFPLEFINLGFSGNGKGEPEVAEVIADIPDPACLVLDYDANVDDDEQLGRTLPAFIRIYRNRHPNVPILVVSRIRFGRERFDLNLNENRLRKMRFQQEAVEACRRQGDERIFFADGADLLDADDFEECTVDGIHPTDLGFLRMADALTPRLERLLQTAAQR